MFYVLCFGVQIAGGIGRKWRVCIVHRHAVIDHLYLLKYYYKLLIVISL